MSTEDKVKAAATAAARGASDAATLLRERLSHAPRLPQIAEIRARVEAATQALQQAEADIARAAAAGGQAIGEALRHTALLEAQQKAHRFDAPAEQQIIAPVDALPPHL